MYKNNFRILSQLIRPKKTPCYHTVKKQAEHFLTYKREINFLI